MDSQMNYELDSQQNAYSFYKAIVITSKDAKKIVSIRLLIDIYYHVT